ncbi:hypothetical protein N44_02570 [Microcystis aeruginosa NIES-44]|uniref:Uncharacterized protein n=1 Tax=Microcystis aeruginosa NIES-44 TaxID=449439 RepID=A0A0A1VWA2_MICAE|nr:hypothetical protein N44_02570 [Microcystis aeruginosa NIES-44]
MPQKLPKFILIYDCEPKQLKLKISYSTILPDGCEKGVRLSKAVP